MTAYVVTEGQADAAILGSILGAIGILDLSITAARGKALTTSLARSIAHVRKSPVAVVVDSDTYDESVIRQQSEIFRDLTTGLSRWNECRLFQAVPTLESELFPAAKDFEELLSVKLSRSDKEAFKLHPSAFVRKWITEADKKGDPLQINPEKAWQTLAGSHLSGLVEFLNATKHAVPVGLG